MRIKTIYLGAVLTVATGLLHAQADFKVMNRPVQIHSFASQGFAYSNDNNYLTMRTSEGSFAFTDAGANISMRVSDKFRVGAQFYLRNVGNLGNFRPEVDWALGDYKFTGWFGVRAGKVKTTLGLYNDIQDLEFLHTWALLPQSAYPLDLRASTIAHTGVDLYGAVAVKRLGTFSYTGYAGSRADDPNGGYMYGLVAAGMIGATTNGDHFGGDLRWTTPLKGLQLGVSYLDAPAGGKGYAPVAPTVTLPVSIDLSDHTSVFYGEYKTGGLTLAGEYRRELMLGTQQVSIMPAMPFNFDVRSWWASAAYRFRPWIEVGTYRSCFYPDWSVGNQGKPENHMFDQTFTVRLDLNRHWDLKLEGHLIDGYGTPYSFRGFYPQDNPNGLKPNTNMFIIRTGWNF